MLCQLMEAAQARRPAKVMEATSTADQALGGNLTSTLTSGLQAKPVHASTLQQDVL